MPNLPVLFNKYNLYTIFVPLFFKSEWFKFLISQPTPYNGGYYEIEMGFEKLFNNIYHKYIACIYEFPPQGQQHYLGKSANAYILRDLLKSCAKKKSEGNR